MSNGSYVLITPVRNEEATIEITIESVIHQTIPPKEWIIVSDGSTDGTDEIVRRYASQCSFLRLLRLDRPHMHSFAAVVYATEAGFKAVRTTDFDFVGLLDGDVRFRADYYERLIEEFKADRTLGLGGGWARDVVRGKFLRGSPNLREVAGATQFFRRSCFESLGGLMPIPEGGWDAITCVRARMNGFRTRTFPGLVMEHLKPRNAAFGNPVRRKWQMGVRDYALAGHPLFETVKCLSHLPRSPLVVGAVARFAAFLTCWVQGRKITLPPDLAQFVRQEQLARCCLSVRSPPRGSIAGRKSFEVE